MVMDGSSSPAKSGSKVSKLKPETQSSKRRKVVEKTVMRVSIGENAGKLKHEGPPSDFWSWRKYGQKPIKGSPYPRGYYRCSTSKGCSAKKQVERCRTEASVLVITYTSTHNHPGPDPHNLVQQPKDAETQLSDDQDPPATPDQEQDPQQQEQLPQDLEEEDLEEEDRIKQSVIEPAVIRSGIEEEQHSFHYLQSPLTCSEEILIISEQDDPFAGKYSSHSRTEDDALGIVLDGHQDPITILSSSSSSSSSCPKVMAFPTTQEESEENDFFNELEELPTPSAFTSFMRGNFFDERIPIVPF